MQQPQIVAYGLEGRLAEQLRELAGAHRVWLREVTQLTACRTLLRDADPAVLVLLLGRDLSVELALLDEATDLLPAVRAVVIADGGNAALAGLAWDLGAHFVLFPPFSGESLTAVVRGLIAEPEPGRRNPS